MKIRFAVLTMLIGIGVVFAAEPLNLLQTEDAFAKTVGELGIRYGFLQYMNKQAITFAPEPVNAFDYYTNRKPTSTRLRWYPVAAWVASSRDFGVDTGPWTAEWSEAGKTLTRHGEFLTVWSRNKDGDWRFLFDAGVPHEAPVKELPALAKDAGVYLPKPKGEIPGPAEVHSQLAKLEQKFTDLATRDGLRAAYAALAATDIHYLQVNEQPAVGKSAVLAAVPAGKATLEWVPMGGSSAASGDLGYLYGLTYQAHDTKHAVPQSAYVHVWRRVSGEWKLQVDMEQPLPPSVARQQQ